MKTSKVLVTNGILRKSLAITRSLGARGIEVYVADTSTANLSAWSRYSHKRLTYPDPRYFPDEFFQWLVDVVQREKIELVIPADDDVLDVIVPLQHQLQGVTRLLIPPRSSYLTARDKGLALRAVADAGFMVPKTWFPESDMMMHEILDEIPFPAVIRPRSLSGSRGFFVAEDKASLLAAYARHHHANMSVMIQEYIPNGERLDVCLIYDQHGEQKASFVQKELRHFPVPHGPSTAQESLHNDELVAKCGRFIESLGWIGVAEMEFMRDGKTGELYFMEINPRFWNSLYLAVIADIDFPWLTFRLGMGQDVDEVGPYLDGIRCRSLFPSDILYFLFNKDRRHLLPSFFASSRIGGQDDIFAWNDIGPFLGFIWAGIRLAFSPGRLKDFFRRE